jgi:hypothetical protein
LIPIIAFIEKIREKMPGCAVMLYGEGGVLSIKTLDNNGYKFQKRYTHTEILEINEDVLIAHYASLAGEVRRKYQQKIGD